MKLGQQQHRERNGKMEKKRITAKSERKKEIEKVQRKARGEQEGKRNSTRRQLQRLSSNLSANESNFMLIVAILSQKKNAIMYID